MTEREQMILYLLGVNMAMLPKHRVFAVNALLEQAIAMVDALLAARDLPLQK